MMLRYQASRQTAVYNAYFTWRKVSMATRGVHMRVWQESRLTTIHIYNLRELKRKERFPLFSNLNLRKSRSRAPSSPPIWSFAGLGGQLDVCLDPAAQRTTTFLRETGWRFAGTRSRVNVKSGSATLCCKQSCLKTVYRCINNYQ